jgi:hypothetical protein
MRRSLIACTFGLSLVAFTPSFASAQELAPPPPMSPSGPAPSWEQGTDTTARLDEAERKDSGRNFELFWIDAKAGGSYINMSQFSSTSFQIKKTDSVGPMVDLGAGVRFVILVLGARVRYNALSAFNMWQINGEVGLKIPVSSLDVHFGLHGGYSFVGALGDAHAATDSSTPTSSDKVSIRGWNAGLEAGVDYYLTPLFSIGVGALGDFLLLNRPPVAKPAGFDLLPADQKAKIENDPLYKQSGTSAGLEIAGGLRLGLHLGL